MTKKNDTPFGKLYNWYAVRDSRKLCPSGWRVATELDWTNLISELDPLLHFSDFDHEIYVSQSAGSELKSTDKLYCNYFKGGATNSTGFSALMNGIRFYNGFFPEDKLQASWWTSTYYNSSTAWNIILDCFNNSIHGSHLNISFGLPVRCIKENSTTIIDNRPLIKSSVHNFTFPGDWESYIRRSILYNFIELEDESISGTVKVVFYLDKEGNVKNVSASNMKGTKLAKLSEDIIRKSPKWTPPTNKRFLAEKKTKPYHIKHRNQMMVLGESII